MQGQTGQREPRAFGDADHVLGLRHGDDRSVQAHTRQACAVQGMFSEAAQASSGRSIDADPELSGQSALTPVEPAAHHYARLDDPGRLSAR